MKKMMIALMLLMGFVLAACGSTAETDANDREVTSSDETTETEEVAAEEPAEEETEESHVGTRSNPLPLGDTITVEGTIYDDESEAYAVSLDLTVTEMIRGEEAWEILLAENEFNEEPAEGYEYAMVKVKGEVVDAETEDYPFWFSSGDFSFVDQEGATYELISVVTPEEINSELYNGGSAEGYIANQVKVDDDFKLSYESYVGAPVFFEVE